jgi:hypothetical protein
MAHFPSLALRLAGALAITAALGATSAVEAQTPPPRHHHARSAKPAPDSGRQITVRKNANSYLTLGGEDGTAVTSPNNYVLDTFSPPSPVAGTMMQGRSPMLDNRFQGEGVPLFRFW